MGVGVVTNRVAASSSAAHNLSQSRDCGCIQPASGESMLTYQVRPRVLMVSDQPKRLIFPSYGEIRFTLTPSEPFGLGDGLSRTAWQYLSATLLWNANTDRDGAAVKEDREPVAVSIQAVDYDVTLAGNVLSVRSYFHSRERLIDMLNAVYYGIPTVLALDFIDVPTISMVTGEIRGVEFVWQFAKRESRIEITNAAQQADRFSKARERLELLLPSKNRRLFAALHYFFTACRLERAGATPWEFMGEVILNYAKILEVLFPSEGESKSIDAARAGLQRVGYSMPEIEKWFIPALALRNGLDVAHVSLTVFPRAQLEVLHAYTEQAEPHFRTLLGKVVDGMADGSFAVSELVDTKPNRDTDRIVRRMAKHFPPSKTES